MTLSNTSNMGFDAANRFALYVEGELCPFVQVERHREVNSVPTLTISLPATDPIRRIRKRARAHMLWRDDRDTWTVLMEAEIVARGFEKNVDSRSFQFVSTHVVGLMDQFAISAIDPASMPAAMMSNQLETGSLADQAGVAAIKGSIMSLLTPDEIKQELKTDKKGLIASQGVLSFIDWVRGAFLRYERIIRGSHIADAYMHRAIVFHRILERLEHGIPKESSLSWDSFFDYILTEMFLASGERVGDRQTFFELLRGLVLNFLYEINIEPSPRRFSQQIQVKPITIFNAIPRCNVLYPSLATHYGFFEDPGQKPTRTEAHFQPVQAIAGAQQSAAVFRLLTVFAPAELQWKWFHLQGGAEGTFGDSLGGNETVPIEKVKPNPVQFLTIEEEERGIVSNYYDVPAMINQALMNTGNPDSRRPAKFDVAAGSSEGARNAVAASLLANTNDDAKIIKYRALLSLALGGGMGSPHGVNRSAKLINGAPLRARYREINSGKGLYRYSRESYAKNQAADFHTIPTRITLFGTRQPVHFKGDEPQNVKQLSVMTGANYVIARNGTIVQTRDRKIHTWAEPRSFPIGLRTPIRPDQANAINKVIPTVEGTKLGALVRGAGGASGTIRFVQAGIDQMLFTREIDFGRDGVTLTPATRDALVKIKNARTTVTVSIGYDLQDGKGLRYHRNLVIDKVEEGTGGLPKITVKTKDGNGVVPVFPVGHAGISDTSFTFEDTSQGYPHGPFWLVSNGPNLKSRPSAGFQSWDAGSLKNQFTIVNGKVNPLHYRERQDQRAFVASNFGALAIALELDHTGKATKEQVDSAAYLTAAAIEMSVQKGFEAPIDISASGSWSKDRLVFEVEAIQNYLGKTYPEAIDSWNDGTFFAAVNVYRKDFHKDFLAIDESLTKGGLAEGAEDGLATGQVTASDTAVPAPATDSKNVANTQAAAEGDVGTVTADYKALDDMESAMKKFGAPVVNFQHYYARFMGQQDSVPGVFNPYVATGYPILIPDKTDVKMHLVAYLHSAHDTITGDGHADTGYSLTHIRPFDEAFIPFSSIRFQEYPIRELEKGSTSEAMKKALATLPKQVIDKKTRYGISSHLPIVFHGIGPLTIDQNPVPFVYDAGFGLAGSGKTEPDFSVYTQLAGVGAENGSDWKNNLIFADSMEHAERASKGGSAQTFDFDAGKTAYEAFHDADGVYRPIQAVGDTGARASVVEFDPEYLKDGKHPSLPPPRIKVRVRDYASTEIKEMAWVEDIQRAVQEHRTILEQRRASPG